MMKKQITLYNTMTRKKQVFVPIDGKTAKVYSCGPTVYNSPSIGNMRAYIFTDILKRTIRMAGYDVFDIVNITDVGHLQSDGDDGEDKIEVSARKNSVTVNDIVTKYISEFTMDAEKLNIIKPKVPYEKTRATSYIEQMKSHIEELAQNGFTYETRDGIYFDSSKFPDYYKLSGKRADASGDVEGFRVAIGEKRSKSDFALWKFTPETAIQTWASPLGIKNGDGTPKMGCPGWHIECSAIARHYLGDTFDIHTGGVDHINIHHTNEIAQTESVTKKEMSRFWMHNEFVMVNNTKMSKSLGNVYTISQLENGETPSGEKYSPMHFRYLMLGVHYRSIANFTFEALDAAKTSYERLVKTMAGHVNEKSTATFNGDNDIELFVDGRKNDFIGAMFDDLNTTKALSVVWSVLGASPDDRLYKTVLWFDDFLGLGLENAVIEYIKDQENEKNFVAPNEIIEIANARLIAKQNKDWGTADELREKATEMGYAITDTKDGFEIKKL